MTESFAGRIRRRVSLVVQPIDDVTDQPVVKSGIHIWIGGEPLPIRKTEGYYIFTDLCREQAVLSMEGDGYETRHLAITLRENGADWQLLRPRLTPGKNHPLAGQTVRILGTAEPYAYISGLWSEPMNQQNGGAHPRQLGSGRPRQLGSGRPKQLGSGRPEQLGSVRPQQLGSVYPLRLGRDYVRKDQEGKENNKLFIYCPEPRDLTGRLLYISDSRSGSGEFFRLLREEVCEEINGRYLLSTPLSRDYSRAGCFLFPAYGVRADQNGTFFMAIPGIEGESSYLLEARSLSGTVRAVFRFRPGDRCVRLESGGGMNL